MIIYVLLDTDNYIQCWAKDKTFDWAKVEIPEDTNINKLPYCKYINGVLTYNPQKELDEIAAKNQYIESLKDKKSDFEILKETVDTLVLSNLGVL